MKPAIASPHPKKEKAGFWCPDDIRLAVKDLIEKGVYADQSKAIVALLRTALQAQSRFPTDLQTRVDDLVAFLQRDTNTILRLCVEGVFEMIDGKGTKSPLIIEEFRLRQKRRPR